MFSFLVHFRRGEERTMKNLASVIASGLLAAAVGTLFSLPVLADRDGKRDEFPRPLVIGHRGAHGYLPAHTLEGYSLAIELAADFTLAEIKQLRAVQDFAERPHQLDGKFEIPTLQEIIALAKRKSEEKGRPIGIYPETKHPTYHKSIGLPLEKRLVEILSAAGWNR